MSFLLVITTTDQKETAERIAKTVVQERLAACVQIVPKITSYYWWEGKVECAQELLIFMKTTKEKYQILENRTKELHNYTVPEIIALPIKEGLKDYLDWIVENLC